MRHTSTTRLAIAACLVVGLSACGGDDDADTADDAPAAADEPARQEPADDAATDNAPADDAPTDDAAADETTTDDAPADDAPAGGGDGTATLTLDNGETFEFGILCSLEPQMAAGSEILFTVVSYDDPSLDITQFGDEGTITGTASVSVYDSSFETLWEASSFYEAVGGTLELTLDGSTVRGEGSFFPNADIAAEPVDGVVEARC